MATRHAYDSDSSDEDTTSIRPVGAGPIAGPSAGTGAGTSRSRAGAADGQPRPREAPPLSLSPRQRGGSSLGGGAMPPPPRRFALDMDEDMDDDDDAAAWPGSDSDAQRGSSVFDSDTRSRYDVRGASTLSPGPGLGQGLGPTPTEIIDALGQEPPQRGGQGYGDTRIAEPGAALTRLRAAWQAERGAPELRIWEAEAVGAVEAMVEEQGSILSTLAADDDTTEEEHLRLSLVAVDMERARWLLKAYLQTRLGKLEQYATYISGNSAEVLKLSAAERKYLNDFAALRTSTLKSTVLDHLPTEWTGLKDQLDYDAWTSDMVDKPPLDSPVFVRCLRDSETLQLPDGSTAEMRKGSMHLLRYSAIKSLLDRGRVELL